MCYIRYKGNIIERLVLTEKGRHPLSMRQHGIVLQEWMWNMTQVGYIKKGMKSSTQYIEHCIREQSKRDKIYKEYEEILNKHSKLSLEGK
jgi:hypothetical protein